MAAQGTGKGGKTATEMSVDQQGGAPQKRKAPENEGNSLSLDVIREAIRGELQGALQEIRQDIKGESTMWNLRSRARCSRPSTCSMRSRLSTPSTGKSSSSCKKPTVKSRSDSRSWKEVVEDPRLRTCHWGVGPGPRCQNDQWSELRHISPCFGNSYTCNDTRDSIIGV